MVCIYTCIYVCENAHYFHIFCFSPTYIPLAELFIPLLFLKESPLEDDVVEGVAAMSPFTADDTREGLHSKLRQVHGDTEGAAENLTWSQKTR